MTLRRITQPLNTATKSVMSNHSSLFCDSQTVDYSLPSGSTISYRRLASGTCYHRETPEAVVAVLESVRQQQRVVRLYYGDIQTGQSWFEEHDVIGTIGRSIGAIKVPLLIASGELGGGAILDHCLIRIDSPRKVLYQHPTFRVGDVDLKQVFDNTDLSNDPNHNAPKRNNDRYNKTLSRRWQVYIDEHLHAQFQDKRHAQRYCDFIQGNRFSGAVP